MKIFVWSLYEYEEIIQIIYDFLCIFDSYYFVSVTKRIAIAAFRE